MKVIDTETKSKLARKFEKESDPKLKKYGEVDLRNARQENDRKKLKVEEKIKSNSNLQKEVKLREKVQIWDQFFVEKRAVVKNEMASDKNVTGVGEEQLRSEKGQENLTQLETKPNVGDKKKKEGQILKGTAVGKEQKGKKPRIS